MALPPRSIKVCNASSLDQHVNIVHALFHSYARLNVAAPTQVCESMQYTIPVVCFSCILRQRMATFKWPSFCCLTACLWILSIVIPGSRFTAPHAGAKYVLSDDVIILIAIIDEVLMWYLEFREHIVLRLAYIGCVAVEVSSHSQEQQNLFIF